MVYAKGVGLGSGVVSGTKPTGGCIVPEGGSGIEVEVKNGVRGIGGGVESSD